MKKPPSALEWQSCDGQGLDDQAWQAVLVPTAEQGDEVRREQPVCSRTSLHHHWPSLAALILFVAFLYGWTRWPVSADPPRLERSTPEAIQVSSPLETIYFRFHFYPHDAQAVQAVAAQLDRQYEHLRQEFALGPLSLGSKVTIKVGYPITSATQLFNPAFDDNTLVVPAKFLSATGAPGAEATLIRYAENWLAGRALDEAIQQAMVRPQWRPTLDGLRHIFWLRQRYDRVLRPEWIYIALQRPLPAAPAWMSAPNALIDDDAIYLDQTIYMHPEALALDFAVITTFTDYLLVTYGRQRLPDLLDGFSRYDSWKELSPAVFGITAGELEAGWHAYLENSPDRSKEAVNGFPRAD